MRQFMRTTRKRSFLLFELLISLTLIALCLFPLIKPHALMHKSEREYLERMQLDLAAQTAFCRLKQLVYERQIPWDQLMHGTQGALEGVFTIRTGKKTFKTCGCHYTITPLDDGKKLNPPRKGLAIAITLEFTPKIHFYRTLFLEKHTI